MNKFRSILFALLFVAGCTPAAIFETSAPLPEAPISYPRAAAPFDTRTLSGLTYGIANLGGARYPEVMRKAHPRGFANVQFTNTFGDAYDSIDALLATGKVKVQEYNLRWSDTHSFSRADFPAIVKEAKKYVALVNKYPSVGCVFSGATEHKLNERDAAELSQRVLAVIPERCVYSNNPWVGKGAFVKPSARVWNEVHGADVKPPSVGGKYIWNADGSSCVDSNITEIKKTHADAVMQVCWHPGNNGRLNAADPTPRPKRKAWATEELIESLAYLFTDKGTTRVPSNWIWKSHADRHETPPEARAYKPVVICPVTAPYLELKKDGKLVGRTGGPLPFADGRKRYYLPKYGMTYPKGSNIWANGKRVGKVSPGFRDGSYRP